VKRPPCKWKGQTDADEESTQSAGSPISQMLPKQKAGYSQHASPVNNTPALRNKIKGTVHCD